MNFRKLTQENGTWKAWNGTSWFYLVWRECHYCGKKFLYPRSVLNRRNHRGYYCSLACTGKQSRKLYSKDRVHKTCPICSTPFEVRKSMTKHKVTCGREYCRKQQRTIVNRINATRPRKKTQDAKSTVSNG